MTKSRYTNKTLPSGSRVGDTRFLLKSQSEGWVILAGPGSGHPVQHEPRTRFDPQPFTDGFFRFKSWECWADLVPNNVQQ